MFKDGLTGVSLLFGIFLSFFNADSQPYKTEKAYKEYLLANNSNIDFLEGIWEFKKTVQSGFTVPRNLRNQLPPTAFNISTAPYRVAIIKISDNNFMSFYVNFIGNIYEADACDTYWFFPTAIDGQYIYENGSKCKTSYHDKAVIKSDGDLYFAGKFEEKIEGELSWENITVTATKLSPTSAEIRNYKSKSETQTKKDESAFSLGTAFAISNELIMTCYHVVKGAKQISVRGLDGRFDTAFIATINLYDEDLDVAILKIRRAVIPDSVVLPYYFKQKTSDVGENIFVLGYPLQNSMGQEIKLTTGVISSGSGFLGDTTLYQISAPIQPGNSGGPLFDSRGNLIGLISAKHLKADNVGYALKLNLLSDILKRKGITMSTSKLTAGELSSKVKLFKNYIYSVEVLLQ